MEYRYGISTCNKNVYIIHYVKFKFITYNLCVYSKGLNESKETSDDKGKISLLTTFSCFLL